MRGVQRMLVARNELRKRRFRRLLVPWVRKRLVGPDGRAVLIFRGQRARAIG